MLMFTVLFTEVFTEWYSELDQHEKDSVDAGLYLLMQQGYQLGRPYADTIKGSRLTNLKELRIQHVGKPYRAFFVFDPLRQAIMLCGGDKTSDKRFYNRMITLAENTYQQYLDDMETDK
ncbi:type II toxin-antitoxin system RelE/ParE family toxin [Psychrobacter arenosus]